MTLLRYIVVLTTVAAMATYLSPNSSELVHRSLSTNTNSNLRQDPRTIQRKTSQMQQETTTNPNMGQPMQASMTSGNQIVTNDQMQSRATQQTNNLRPMQTNGQGARQPDNTIPMNVDNQIGATQPGNTMQGKMHTNAQTATQSRKTTQTASNLGPATARTQATQTNNLQKAAGARTTTQNKQASSSVASEPTPHEQATQTTNLQKAADAQTTTQNKQASSSVASESTPQEQAIVQEEDEDEGEAPKEEAVLHVVLQDYQRKRARGVEFLNRDVEKERFLKLMYGRSKVNTSGEY